MKILFLVPYPPKEAPSQRFRFEQYFGILSARGIVFEVSGFLTPANWRLFHKPGNYARKTVALCSGFWRRFLVLFRVFQFDFIFIHREAAPLGPPLMEWIIFFVLRKRIIYDFDDAIWLTDKANEPQLDAFLKWRSKVKSICRWSYKVSCGNEFLRDYASQFNSKAIVNPTTIDTRALHQRHYDGVRDPGKVTIGWTGSHTTLKYLKPLEPVLQHLENKYHQLRFLVIANQMPQLTLKSLVFKEWSIQSEIEDLLKMDIGVMPLDADGWSKGKCGFKVIQYMALEIPAVASPVGVNMKIIKNGISGFLCHDQKEWMEKLELLIADASLRTRLGTEARKDIETNYSVASNSANFLSLFD